MLPRNSLVTIYNLAFADVTFHKLSNGTFSNEIEPAQHNAALAIAGTIRRTSKEKLYQEPVFEIIKERRFPRLCCFYKTMNNQAPAYLYSLFSPLNRHCNTHNFCKIRQIFCKTETFSNSFLSQKIRKWKKLDILSPKLLHVQYFTKYL